MEATHTRTEIPGIKRGENHESTTQQPEKVIDRGGATADQVSRKENIEQEIKDKRKKEYTLHQTLEREAYNMGKAHDRCTAEMFSPWKPNHSAQHIAALLKADWTDPSNPVMEGGVARGEKEGPSVVLISRDYNKASTIAVWRSPRPTHSTLLPSSFS